MLTKTHYVTLTVNFHLTAAATAALAGDAYENARVGDLLPEALNSAGIPFEDFMVDTSTSTIVMQVMIPDSIRPEDVARLVQLGTDIHPYVTRVEGGVLGFDGSLHSPIFMDSPLDGDLLAHFEPFGLTHVTNPDEAYATWSVIVRNNDDGSPSVAIYEVQYPTMYADGSALVCNDDERLRLRFTENFPQPADPGTVTATGVAPESINVILMTSQPVEPEVRMFANQQVTSYMDAVLGETPHTSEMVNVGLAAIICMTMAATLITRADNKRELLAMPSKMEAFAILKG